MRAATAPSVWRRGARGQPCVEPAVGLARVEREVGGIGWRTRTRRAPAGPPRPTAARHAAREDRRHAALESRPGAHGQRVGERRAGERERRSARRAPGRRDREQRERGEHRRGARGRAHRGTGTLRARCERRRPGRSARARPPGVSTSRWRQHGRASARTSSGVTKSRPARRAARAATSRWTRRGGPAQLHARELARPPHDVDQVARDLHLHARGVDSGARLAQRVGAGHGPHLIEVARADAAAPPRRGSRAPPAPSGSRR